MRSAYGFEIQESCLICPVRREREFCKVSAAALEDLQRIRSASFYPAGTLLYIEGQFPRGVFILCSGRAKVFTSSRQGKVIILKIARAGEVLGVEAALGGREHEETAELLESCQVNFVATRDFTRYISEHSDAALKAAMQLTLDCRAAQEGIRCLGLSGSVQEKLARLLLHWTDESHGPERETRLKVPYKHEEIAQMIGSTRETVTRLMGALKKKRIIETKGATLIVKDPERLKQLAGC
ncbi:MAG TPA: Crp/Fnr family transcriptional regulator [Terriglobales bacterium]|jgi:CRP/FNR family transcriptional regulator, cyclic AMP receptor protein|nr:Crp/Fnr family transcriptional regulator [Terriglobales bacterium]